MTLEQRIKCYIIEFETAWIQCDHDFIKEQITEQYPWTDLEPNKSGRKVGYKIYPTKENRDNE